MDVLLSPPTDSNDGADSKAGLLVFGFPFQSLGDVRAAMRDFDSLEVSELGVFLLATG